MQALPTILNEALKKMEPRSYKAKMQEEVIYLLTSPFMPPAIAKEAEDNEMYVTKGRVQRYGGSVGCPGC